MIFLPTHDLERIKQVEEIYGQVSRGIQLRKQELLVQKTRDPRFIQQPATTQPLYPALSKPSEQQQPAYSHQLTYVYHPTHGPQFAYENQFRPTYEQQQPTYEYQLTYGPQHGYGTQHAYENQYWPNEYQPVLNDYQFVPNSLTSKIRDDRECIPKRLTAPTPPALPIQAPQGQVPRIQGLSVTAPLTNAPLTQQGPLTKSTPIQASPAQVPSVPAILIQAPPAQELSTSVPSATNKPDCGQPKKHPERVNPECHGTVHLSENPIQAYKSGFVNHLANYEAVHKSMQPSYLYENGDDKLYFTDRQYRKGGFNPQDLCYHKKKRMKEIEMDEAGERENIMMP